MKILERGKKQFVRIMVGVAETGFSGLKKPIKTINVEDISPDQMYEKILALILDEQNEQTSTRK